jgi:hypothetical protein
MQLSRSVAAEQKGAPQKMTMIRQRICSMRGDLVYIDVHWDSPIYVEAEDGTLSVEDPSATQLIHEVYWRNLTDRQYELTLRHNTQPFVRLIAPSTPEQIHSFAPGQRPDMRQLLGITLKQLTSS